jgi:hypothetical protein
MSSIDGMVRGSRGGSVAAVTCDGVVDGDPQLGAVSLYGE